MTTGASASSQATLAALTHMANSVGHELRNPLAVIQNGVYLLGLMLSDAEPQVRETLELVSAEVEETAKIISSLLDFGRPRTLVPQTTDMNELVALALARVTLPPDIEVRRELDAELPEIAVDAEQIVLALCKLMDNSVKAMPEGGRLTLTSSCGSDTVIIGVADTGVGVSAEPLEVIFEPFFTTRAGSIGLGLPIARAVIEDHGGTLEAKSRVGEGTTLTMRLPCTHPIQ